MLSTAMNWRRVLPILAVGLLFTSLFFGGCGEVEDDPEDKTGSLVVEEKTSQFTGPWIGTSVWYRPRHSFSEHAEIVQKVVNPDKNGITQFL